MFDRIISNPDILAGKPCIKGTRISVEMIVEWAASGSSINDIVQTYTHLEVQDVEQALRYAARFLKNEVNVTAEIAP